MPKMPKMPKIPTKILTAMGSYRDSPPVDKSGGDNKGEEAKGPPQAPNANPATAPMVTQATAAKAMHAANPNVGGAHLYDPIAVKILRQNLNCF